METDECVYCKNFPGTATYLNWAVIPCPCGNPVKRKEIPAIYIGQTANTHVFIIAFPGCVVCGRPANTPMVIQILCSNEEHAKMRFQEIYHNYGTRN